MFFKKRKYFNDVALQGCSYSFPGQISELFFASHKCWSGSEYITMGVCFILLYTTEKHNQHKFYARTLIIIDSPYIVVIFAICFDFSMIFFEPHIWNSVDTLVIFNSVCVSKFFKPANQENQNEYPHAILYWQRLIHSISFN